MIDCVQHVLSHARHDRPTFLKPFHVFACRWFDSIVSGKSRRCGWSRRVGQPSRRGGYSKAKEEQSKLAPLSVNQKPKRWDIINHNYASQVWTLEATVRAQAIIINYNPSKTSQQQRGENGQGMRNALTCVWSQSLHCFRACQILHGRIMNTTPRIPLDFCRSSCRNHRWSLDGFCHSCTQNGDDSAR